MKIRRSKNHSELEINDLMDEAVENALQRRLEAESDNTLSDSEMTNVLGGLSVACKAEDLCIPVKKPPIKPIINGRIIDPCIAGMKTL